MGKRKYPQDLTGLKFQKLTGVREAGHVVGNKHERCWIFRCDCGKEKRMRVKGVVSGKTQTCGCLWRWPARENSHAWRGCGQLSASLITRIRLAAKRRGIPFLLNTNQLWALWCDQSGRCALSGAELTLPPSHADHDRYAGNASLDRIDSSRPYEPGNVQWVLKKVNMMKQQYDQAEFVELCRMVVNHHNTGALS